MQFTLLTALPAVGTQATGFERGAESLIFLGVFLPAQAAILNAIFCDAAAPSILPQSSAANGPKRKALPVFLQLSCSFPAAFRTLAHCRAERKRSSSGRYGLCCPRCQNSPWAGPAPRTYGRSSNQEQGSAAPSAARTNGIGSVSWESRQMKRVSLGKAKEPGVKIWLLALSSPWAGWRCAREADCLFLTPGTMHWVLLSAETCSG